MKNEMDYKRSSTESNFKSLSIPLRILYVGVLAAVIIGIAVIQGYLTIQNETDLIDIQIGQTCNAVFDAIERGWTEVQLFTETISGGFYADELEVTQAHYTRLAQSAAVQSIAAMTSLQFVRHLANMTARAQWESEVKVEFNTTSRAVFDQIITAPGLSSFYSTPDDFYMFGFNRSVETGSTNANGGSSFDPIIYQTAWDSYLWGFFPDPEPPRIAAIDAAIENDELACSSRINLFGHQEDRPAGMVCFMPLWTNANGEAIATKLDNSTADDVFGFVNPMIKFHDFMKNIFESKAFGTDVDDVVIYLYDVTNDENAVTGNKGSSFLGTYPTIKYTDKDKIGKDTHKKTVLENGDYSKVKSKTINVATRKWGIFCAIEPEYISSKRTALPYIIAALSVGVSIVFQGFRMFLNNCMAKTQKRWSVTSSSRDSQQV